MAHMQQYAARNQPLQSPSTNMAHYNGVIRRAMSSQITCVSIVCSTICSGADQRKHQCSALLADVRGPVTGGPHKGPVKRKIFPFYDVGKMRCNCSQCHDSNKTQHLQINVKVLLISRGMLIAYASTIYTHNRKTGFLNHFNVTCSIRISGGYLRLKELKSKLWNHRILNYIFVIKHVVRNNSVYNYKPKLEYDPELILAQTLTLSTSDRSCDHFTCRRHGF